MTVTTNSEVKHTFDIDDSGSLLLYGEPIGSIHSPAIKDILRKQDSSQFSQALIDSLHPVSYQYDVCPHCGHGHFHELAHPNDVAIGYCLDCYTPIYIVDRQWYCQIGNHTGYYKRSSIL